jgi:hypothetical protein
MDCSKCLICLTFSKTDQSDTLNDVDTENVEKEVEKEMEKEMKEMEKEMEKEMKEVEKDDSAFEMDAVMIEPDHKQVLESPIVCNEMYIKK